MEMRNAEPAATAIVEAHGVTREFKVGGGIVRALRGIEARIEPGELVALRGRSGSGKTTLLNILTGIDSPTQGQVHLLGHDLARLNETARAILRREQVGILFQNAHLFPLLTAQENTELPLRLARLLAALLQRIAHEQGIGMLVATHDPVVVTSADRVLTISDGMLV